MPLGDEGSKHRNKPQGFVFPHDLHGFPIHLIGIGGSGMCGAAALLNEHGAAVSGSDMVAFDGLGQLVSRGVRIFIGHSESQLPADAQLIIASAAIPAGNPESSAARQRGIPVLTYAEFLGAFMARRRGVAIAGTHGKSTTSGMCVHLFNEAGLSPSFVIGARSSQLGGSSGLGSGEHFIVESCEFKRSFLQLQPESAVILNIEPDHLDCYRNLDDIIDAFARFAAGVKQNGRLVCNGEDAGAMHAASFSSAAVETFGFAEGMSWRACDLQVDQGRYTYEVWHDDVPVLRTALAIPGRYNVANSLAAIALAHHAGASYQQIADALPTFVGVDRRMTLRMKTRGITLLDDYAHHPTEIRVTIEAARSRYQPRRTLVVFQPHQYSRTKYFMDQFADSFHSVDQVIIPEVYGAREKREEFIFDGSEELVSRICRRGGRATYMATLEAVADHLTNEMTEGDLVMTMGAGDVWKVADELVERFRDPNRAGCPAGQADVVSAGRSRPVPVSTA